MIVPVDINYKTQRGTKWVCVCPTCQHERIISYAQKFNLLNNKATKQCKACKIRLGLIKLNLIGLEKGRKYNPKNTKYTNKGTLYRNLFVPVSDETRIKQRLKKLNKIGNLSNGWIDGRCKENKLLRSRDEYKQLRKNVFKRDNYTCQICYKTKTYIQMDHIKEWCNYPELRFEITNCRTLCLECHKKTPNFGNKAKRVINGR